MQIGPYYSMNAIQSMSDSLEADYEDLDNIHKKLSKMFHNNVGENDEEEFNDNHRNLVNGIGQIANAKLGIFRNYKIQKQLDELNKMIDRLPEHIKRQYFAMEVEQ